MFKLQKKLLPLLCLLFSIVSESKSCTEIEKVGLDCTVSDISKKFMVMTLENTSTMNDQEKHTLQRIADDNKDCFTFGTKEDNEKSFKKWILYSRSLYALACFGDKNAKEILQEEFQERRYRLQIIDCYVSDKPYDLCLLGIWNQVATYDRQEREKLIIAAEKGKIIPRDKKLSQFWKNYNFSFIIS